MKALSVGLLATPCSAATLMQQFCDSLSLSIWNSATADGIELAKVKPLKYLAVCSLVPENFSQEQVLKEVTSDLSFPLGYD